MSFTLYLSTVLPTDSNESVAISRAKTIVTKYLSEDELTTVTLSIEGDKVKVDSSQAILMKMRKGLKSEPAMAIIV
jgi:hypothetical protein